MNTAENLLDIASAELGTTEYPPGSNKVKYNTWYYGREVSGSSYPWCMAFVQWCFHQAGVDLPIKTASCGALMRAAKKAGCWVASGFQPGDVVIYDFPGGAATDHCGIIESADKSTVTAIEGNTSEKGSQSNGGMVCRKKRPLSQVVGVVRPKFTERKDEDDMTAEEVRKIAEEAVAKAAAQATAQAVEKVFPIYHTLEDVPEWYAPTVKKLMDKGALKGTGSGMLDLSGDLCRALTLLDRLGKLD